MKNRLFHWSIAVILSFFLTANTGAAWVLRAEDGLLRVRDLESGAAVLDTGIPLSALPERDRPALEAGVVLRDHTALTKALEDFCS